MVFSSPVFLFLFLPIVLIVYFFLNKSAKNIFLLIASLFFYAWGEGILVLLMIFSICINYLGGLGISATNGALKQVVLLSAVAINLAFLLYYKYLNFFLENLQQAGFLQNLYVDQIVLPIGISFFTFQSISYLVDVYRGEAMVQRSPFDLGLYISLFPQLIAGPIVRYHDIDRQIQSRSHNASLFSRGVIRFIRGFAKKMIIANPMALLADQAFNAGGEGLPILGAWIGIICYSLQIYFDFSGYSDMAIGIGRMLGFRFLENFQWPYISKSIQEFWRRWHISLSSWFRDYLYIPLGGNRKGSIRTYVNLFIVFLATGFWHGAAWNFIVWGLYHGLFLIIERLGFGKRLNKLPGAISHFYLILVVMIGWVFFRAENLSHAITYIGYMFGIDNGENTDLYFSLSNYNIFILLVGIIFSTNLRRVIQKLVLGQIRKLQLSKRMWPKSAFEVGRVAFSFLLFIWALAELAQNSYNPFIYFRF